MIFTISAMLQGCKTDVFNPEKVQAAYQDRFPVKNIDPAMDWKMTGPVKVRVSVSEDAGVDYIVRIYDKNPLSGQSSAKLLAEGTANNTAAFTTVMDCPTTLTSAFVCRVDARKRNVVKYVSIENGQLNASFGSAAAKTRAASTRSVDIETYTPEKSEAKIREMLADATEIKNPKFENGQVYKISKNEIFRGKIESKNVSSSGAPATIIVEGTWEPKGENMSANAGFEFYVLNGGEIIIPDGKAFTLTENSNFTVYAGGIIKGYELKVTDASEGKYSYNAGSIEVSEFEASGNGTFYNCGTITVKNKMDFSSDYKFINQGKAYIGETDDDIVIDNGCYLSAGEFEGTLNMGSLSFAEIEELESDDDHKTRVTMDANSMMIIKKAKLEDARFAGPDSGYALVKIEKIENVENFASAGNIYYEVKEIDDKIDEDSKFLNALKNSDGTISKWGESPILIPEGDCTGEGNTPNDTGSETPEEPLPYTYVFEDNYPLVGDYDFNDVVLDVKPGYEREEGTNNIRNIRLHITLTAAGASKALGAGLRIVGINKSDIQGITFEGYDASRFQDSFANSYNLFDYNSGTRMEDSDPNVVIPIAGEVHHVFGERPGILINTGGNGTTAPIYTLEVNIELADKSKTVPLFSKDNLDFFICYQYKGMQRRMEVHLYEFWRYGATAAGTVQQENLDLAGNNTWAICVPYGFRYPKERINISRADIPEEGAYPYFIEWAKDRTTCQDWYEHPVAGNVYR